MDKECCGTCKWHELDIDSRTDWLCGNADSYYDGLFTDYDHMCEAYEPRDY